MVRCIREIPAADSRAELIRHARQRCEVNGLTHDSVPETVVVDGLFHRYRAHHPMSNVLSVVRDIVAESPLGSKLFAFVTDELACELWASDRAMDTIFQLSEKSAGVTAPALALASGRAIEVCGCEHFSRLFATWWVVAYPVRDAGERLIGTVGIGSLSPERQPAALLALNALASVVELRTSRSMAITSSARDLSPPNPVLTVVGRDSPTLSGRSGRLHGLGRRQSELLLLLSWRSQGLSAEQLATEISENGVSPVTIRAEVSKLRASLGSDDIIRSRPYRVDPAMISDLNIVEELARTDNPLAAVHRLGDGGSLTTSSAPGVRDILGEVVADVRSCVLASRDPMALEAWTTTQFGRHDYEAWQALATSTRSGGWRRARAQGRVQLLDQTLGTEHPAWSEVVEHSQPRSANR